MSLVTRIQDVVTAVGQWLEKLRVVSVPFVIDGSGSTITTGVKGDLQIDFAGTIIGWTVLGDPTGAIVVDIWKNTYANYPPVVGASITASAKPTITATNAKATGSPTGWVTSITAGDVLRYNVDSVTALTRVTVSLKVRKT